MLIHVVVLLIDSNMLWNFCWTLTKLVTFETIHETSLIPDLLDLRGSSFTLYLFDCIIPIHGRSYTALPHLLIKICLGIVVIISDEISALNWLVYVFKFRLLVVQANLIQLLTTVNYFKTHKGLLASLEFCFCEVCIFDLGILETIVLMCSWR